MAGEVPFCFVHFLVQTFNENVVFCTRLPSFHSLPHFGIHVSFEVCTVSQLSGPEYLIIINDIALIKQMRIALHFANTHV